MSAKIKSIAIHLPQFHPIPENDKWWGKGFTEWTNVAKARPLFKGHYQPHLPADLGFYDLRLQEARIAQAELAKAYGIHGFCYYHYWFNGKRLLNKPLDGLLQSKDPDFPFMLCWANENWTRRWDGMESEVLMKQEYSEKDDKQHIHFLLEKFFSDPRYIRVNEKPFLLIYRPNLFPNINKTLECWRKEAEAFGFKGLYLGYMQNWGIKVPPATLGFDCAVEFQPDFANFPASIKPSFLGKVLNKLQIKKSLYYQHYIISYDDLVEKVIAESGYLPPDTFRGVTPMWDNTARKKKDGFILLDSTPEVYGKWLDHVAQHSMQSTMPEKYIFINAWNEWAEGNHLEPCQKWGTAYLETTKITLAKYS